MARVFAYVLLVSRVTSKPRRGLPLAEIGEAGEARSRDVSMGDIYVWQKAVSPKIGRRRHGPTLEHHSNPHLYLNATAEVRTHCRGIMDVTAPSSDHGTITHSFREEGAPISLSCSRKGRNGKWPLFYTPCQDFALRRTAWAMVNID